MKCYKRLTYKQFVQVSGLCGPQFLSCLLKCFTHLCRALYVDAILVYHLSVPIWPPKINKNIWSSRGGSRIFFRRGCTHLLLYFNTNKPNSFFGRIPVVLENRRSSQGGVRTPCTLPLDLPLSSLFLRKLFLFTQELAYVCISSNT